MSIECTVIPTQILPPKRNVIGSILTKLAIRYTGIDRLEPAFDEIGNYDRKLADFDKLGK